MEIYNHKINFDYPLPLSKSLFEKNDQRPFLKVPYYPGWKIKTVEGKQFNAINYNNYLGFPQKTFGKEIIQIIYSPGWLNLLYLQLFSWLIISIYFLIDIFKKIIKTK